MARVGVVGVVRLALERKRPLRRRALVVNGFLQMGRRGVIVRPLAEVAGAGAVDGAVPC